MRDWINLFEGKLDEEELGIPALDSFKNFMSNSTPLHQHYEKGDCLTYRGQRGVVKKANATSLLMDFSGQTAIIARNDPNLEVTPHHLWESIEFETMAGPETSEYVQDHDPDLLRRGSRIKYFDPSEVRKETHILAFEDDQIVGVGGVQVDPHNPENLWIKFISVDPEYQGRGIAKDILRRIYAYAEANGLKMAPGGFTQEGERLRHLHDIYDKEFPSVAYSRDEAGNYVNDKGKIVRDNK